MPPYYPDQANGQYEYNQTYYQGHSYQFQSPQNQVHNGYQLSEPLQPQARVPQVIIPQRQSQSQPYYSQHQQPIQYQTSQLQPGYYDQSPLNQAQYYNQQAFTYNQQQQYQQQFPPQPRPLPQVNVSPSPKQNEYHVPQPTRLQPPKPSSSQQAPTHQLPRPQPTPQIVVPPSPSTYQQPSNRSAQQQPLTSQPSPKRALQMPQRRYLAESRVLQDGQTGAKQQSIPRPITKPVASSTEVLPVQYPALLISLADEYMVAAVKMKQRTEEYHQLVATALGCLEATLKNFKLSPLREAQLSLKYAQLLYDETNNLDDAEIILTRSIDLCERMKFTDLKYATQLLLAKVLFRTKPRAAMRDLQSMIEDIETYRHTAWEYPFRFQAIFFATEASGFVNLNDAIHQLEKVQHLAKQNQDHVIYAFAATLESLLYLHSPTAENISNSQSALAKARSMQLNPDVEKHPQMPAIMEFIDMIWNLNDNNEEVVNKKRLNLRETLYKSIDSNEWSKDGLTWLRLNSRSLKGMPTQDGGLIHEIDGKHYIALSWISKKELEAIGFLISGLSSTARNQVQLGKAEQYLNEGSKIPDEEILEDIILLNSKDEDTADRAHILVVHFVIELTFSLCTRGQWPKAQEKIKKIEQHQRKIRGAAPKEFEPFVCYLKGCIDQATGNLDSALSWFQSPTLILQLPQTTPSPAQKTKIAPQNQTLRNLQLLAAINTAMIIRPLTHPQHSSLRSIIDNLSSHFATPTALPIPPVITATHSLLLSTLPGTPVLQTKQLLGNALQAAKQISNNQIIALTLTLMQDKFFRGGVQDAQAVKCAKAASHQVKTRWWNGLWAAVAGELEVESLVLQGMQNGLEAGVRGEEVQRKKGEVVAAWEGVPERVKVGMGMGKV